MKTRFFLYTLSLAKYLFMGVDVKHLYVHFHDKVDLSIFIFLGLTAITLEILALSPNAIKTVSMEYRKRIQLGIHIALSLNSLGWMIYDYKSIWNIVFFLIAIGFNFFILHKVLHAIHLENEESRTNETKPMK